ncbi:bifunctional metallophosphatase/5'-nucleotidase [Oceanobacillus caeni]|uniref:bifunctional metallophosphatase/5'-nucleotidase n=1 Tax=Oceanobacillus caeni TaxID=405946 RepID=UPI000622665E|nr:bifunctional UDP-sugar hydrolase/5'-nucleotidase [Oceanobacillus caeni]KKE79553.1 metallophosphoesterase [Bacilli bacterium VT-13-104]PZD89737.1 bifunctional metallophosphatase/5'-nucleotidase [Bacilli bacterium]MBU8792085.1 bifunctional metallophosphatase/5'-nucleotidase [Oceanobacillus caeni]MCR1833484.1 bifunctional metallophosphatase/5'-nucleotidase [Oceanobacillus caeni]PZD91259.1 bifunctional metallophosphatase/5'-nucleotidase [Bacilli bacterium]
MKEKLYFYYTNDLHSNFEQWPRVAAFIKESIAARNVRDNDYWLFDIGDHMDRVHPISEATKGKANIQLMNDLRYDVVTFGNNEGITLAYDDLYHLYDDAEFDVVCTNLHSSDNQNPLWLNRQVKLTSESGVRIGILGLTAPFNDYYHLLGWHISSAFDELDKYVHELSHETDIIVLLSHLGLSEDQEIARRYKDIDVIIGGHTHHLLRTGEKINNTIITAAGKHCSFVGEVILTWDHNQKKLINQEAYATDISEYENDTETEHKIMSLQEDAEQRLNYPIVYTDYPIEVRWFKNTKVMRELTNTLREFTKADIAMLNSGLLLDSLPAGKIAYKDVHRICPHPINAVTVELTGSEILEVIRVSLTKQFTEFQLKGFGFRGKVLGEMVFSGIEVVSNFHPNGEKYVKTALLPDGSELDANQTYKLGTADVFTFGRLLPEIAKSDTKHFFLPEFLRDLLVKTLEEHYS